MCGPIEWLDDKEKSADYSRLSSITERVGIKVGITKTIKDSNVFFKQQ